MQRRSTIKAIGIQGGAASYHEQVALTLHSHDEITYYGTFHELFNGLKTGEVQSIICAISNTHIGPIAEANAELATLASKYRVLHEISLPVHHALLVPTGSVLTNIRSIHSQRPAFDQCSAFLARVLPEAQLFEEEDTALSARLIAVSGDRTKAAIASETAGKLYNLTPILTNIQDDPDNITNFIELELI